MSKAAKASAKAGSSSKISPLDSISRLEASCTSRPFNPNPLLPLLALSRHSDAEVVHKTIWALHRVFVRFINENRVGGINESARRAGHDQDGLEDDEESPKDEVSVKSWIRDRLLEYVDVLGSLLRDSEPALRSSAVPLLFSLLGPLSASVSHNKPIIHTLYFRLLLRACFNPAPSLRGAKQAAGGSGYRWEVDQTTQCEDEDGLLPMDVIELLDEDFWAKYDDIRWMFFKEAAHLLNTDPSCVADAENLLGQLIRLTNLPRVQEDINAFYLPSMATAPSSASTVSVPKKKKTNGKSKKANGDVDALPDWMATYESESEEEEVSASGKRRQRTTQMSIHASIHSVQSHTSAYTSLWEAVLSRLNLDDVQTRRVLVGLHGENGILGHMRADRRVRVADWLGGLVDQGGAKAMLAMNGLFVLMTKYNLDYPDFYKRLYGLLDCNVLHVKYRARFFRLLDTFLASPLLPAAIIASFIKRLSRLSLTAPPAGTIIVIPFIYNLFKRHPGCMVMIQRHAPSTEEDGGQSLVVDPFKADEVSPLTSGAINSSCWELASLQHHYLPSISTLAKVFTEVFTKPEYSMEDFLDHGYDTLFTTEANRKIKNPPALSMNVESGDLVDPFPKSVTDGMEQDEVARLWKF